MQRSSIDPVQDAVDDMPANGQRPLSGKVALVAGATRGAGRAFAVELAAAGATVYATGRSSEHGRSEMGRPETIEGTATRAAEAGGKAVPVVCDHLEPVAGQGARVTHRLRAGTPRHPRQQHLGR
jgi:NAD(P)-dependent dehydrogenase (short-subunit alcohol dehydrogenase family)